ncbi:MAG: SPOR domain-containing protein [Candidatus Hydrogenedentes bacterium]|jgi:hypothetical protein|nr:SPOR domain-containing protein [Candidatus Hydrogenedentota bacterium]
MTAEQKKSPRESKSLLDQEMYRAELSSAQLVLGISVLLIFGLACFMLGIVVGKVEPADPPKFAQRLDAPAPNVQSQTGNGASGKPSIETDTAVLDAPPRTTTPDVSAKALSVGEVSESNPALRPVAEAAAHAWDEANLENGTSNAEPDDDRPNHILPPATAASDTLEKEEPKPAVRPKDEPQAPLSPSEPPAAEDGTPTGAVAANGGTDRESNAGKIVETSAPAQKLSFSVQVLALNSRQRAVRAKADIEKRSSYLVQLKDAPNGGWVNVLVGEFATLAAAKSAKEEIRKSLGYTDAFVRRTN